MKKSLILINVHLMKRLLVAIMLYTFVAICALGQERQIKKDLKQARKEMKHASRKVAKSTSKTAKKTGKIFKKEMREIKRKEQEEEIKSARRH